MEGQAATECARGTRPGSGHLTVIVKPTVDCNLGCQYCYEGTSPYKHQRMSPDTLRNTIGKFANHHNGAGELEFIWHGGEPLLMGLDFYRTVLEQQRDVAPDTRFRNALQTNGTLLSADFAGFLVENGFKVGISVDGPSAIHDRQRRFADGTPSHESSMQGITNLRAANAAASLSPRSVGVISTFTEHSLERADDLYEFHAKNQLSAKFNPLFFEGRGKDQRQNPALRPANYVRAMLGIFDRWVSDLTTDILIHPFDEIMANMLFGTPGCCVFMGRCYESFVTVLPNGDVYPCGQWSLDGYKLGNINEHGVDEILAGPVVDRLRRERARANEKCFGCEFFSICNSGCLKQSYMRRQSLTDKDYFCFLYKALFGHIRTFLAGELGVSSFPLSDLVVLDHVEHPVIRRVVDRRRQVTCRSEGWKGDWTDSKWAQWRGEYNEHKDWNENTPFSV